MAMKWTLLFAAALTASAGVGPREVKIDRDSAALEFKYQWSSEAAAIPALNRKLKAKAATAYAEAIKFAREDQAASRQDKRPFHQHSFGTNWETAGQTPRLLSLEAAIYTFTGGAHPNSNVAAELWDQRLGKPIKITDLFTRPASFAALTRAAYCKALDKERLERRGGEKFDGQFDECPKYSELVIAPRDREPDGRFEAFEFVAAPYTAGPYVEGEYGISVPVTGQLTAALKPQYRASFEVQPQ